MIHLCENYMNIEKLKIKSCCTIPVRPSFIFGTQMKIFFD